MLTLASAISLLAFAPLSHRVMISSRVATGDEVFDLALDVVEQAARAEAEEISIQPGVAQLFFHQDQPVKRLLGRANAACWLKTDAIAGRLLILADRAHHHEAVGQRRVDRLFAGRGLDEVGSGHHADPTGARRVTQRA